jgi:hypothetical protein
VGDCYDDSDYHDNREEKEGDPPCLRKAIRRRLAEKEAEEWPQSVNLVTTSCEADSLFEGLFDNSSPPASNS